MERLQLNIRLDGKRDTLEAIKEAAAKSGESINAYCVRILSESVGLADPTPSKSTSGITSTDVEELLAGKLAPLLAKIERLAGGIEALSARVISLENARGGETGNLSIESDSAGVSYSASETQDRGASKGASNGDSDGEGEEGEEDLTFVKSEEGLLVATTVTQAIDSSNKPKKGRTGVQMARHFGVDPSLLSKWWKGAVPIPEKHREEWEKWERQGTRYYRKGS